MTEMTRDSIALRGCGIVEFAQGRKGHRLTLDSLLLADFCRIKSRSRVLEPGAGSGVISLLLAKRHPSIRIDAVEVLPEDAERCRSNVRANGLEGRIAVHERDIAHLDNILACNSIDAIVANPPYTAAHTGRISPTAARAAARHELHGGIDRWLALSRFLKDRGRYFLVFPAERAAELIALQRAAGLEPKRMRLAHPAPDRPASLLLIEAVKSAGVGLSVMPPLFVHDVGGGQSAEIRALYAP